MDMIALTNRCMWYEKIDTMYGTVTVQEWLRLEKERILKTNPSRVCEIRQKGKKVWLEADCLAKS
jgi:hypothetical protein